MGVIDLDATISYIKARQVVLPAVEWRITLNGNVQEVDEEDRKVDHNDAPHINASFMLIASVGFFCFYELIQMK